MRELHNIYDCPCGREHVSNLELVTGNGVIRRVPELLEKHGIKQPYIVADKNTYAAAAKELAEILTDAGVP